MSFFPHKTSLLGRVFALACFGFIFSFPFSSFVRAADGALRLTTSPLPINLSVEPGHSVSTQLRIKNDGDQKEILKIDLMKFKADGESGAPLPIDREPGDDFLDWVHFSEESFPIEQNQWKTINATFDVPETAAFGYYYAIVFSRADDVTVESGKSRVSGGTALLVLLEAKVPGAKREVTVTSFSADHTWYEFLPATFTVKLKNTGNVHSAPRGNLFIGRPGEKADTLVEVNLGKGNILPGSGRFFEAEWTEGFPVYRNKEENGRVMLDAEGHPIRELMWNWKDASKFRFGKYEARLLLVYDDGQRDVPIEGVVEFWVIPWRFLIGGAFIALFVIVGIKSTLEKVWHRIFKSKKSA
ncbi:MAG: hypothetical protein KBB51_00960 [Candidatus Moranbacteria bacterium]|jgi:hypothetical protein|nr:hypothetical protein [Candidatus Moranbacteria bacterium]